MGIFGTAAIGFTAVTLYAVVALIVTLRERDLAIRLAIGAEPSALTRSVLGHGLKLAFTGIAIGLCAAVALGRMLQSTVAAAAADPISMGIAVPALMLVTTVAATYRPARRAAGIDPLQLLKQE